MAKTDKLKLPKTDMEFDNQLPMWLTGSQQLASYCKWFICTSH